MDIRIELAADPPAARLAEADDCKRLHVTVSGGTDPVAVARELARSGLGRLDDDGDHAWLFVDGLRTAASGRVGVEWPAAFEAMIAYADTKGWLSAGGEEVRAHIEWPA